MTEKPKSESTPKQLEWHPEPDYHLAWARLDNIRTGRTKATPEEFEAARIEAEKEGYGPFKKKRPVSPPPAP